MHTPENQQQLWPGKCLTKFKIQNSRWKMKLIGIDFNFGVNLICFRIIASDVCAFDSDRIFIVDWFLKGKKLNLLLMNNY